MAAPEYYHQSNLLIFGANWPCLIRARGMSGLSEELPPSVPSCPVSDVTRILESVENGEASAEEALLPLVYDELRKIAAGKMAVESAGHTLQPTALVHEAWLRLVGSQPDGWRNRAHFFGAAAEAMRRILVEHARRKKSQKRGSGIAAEPFEEATFVLVAPADELLAVHDALDRLALVDPEAAELVKLRYFAGLTIDEAASTLGLGKRTTEGLWTFARTWLSREIRRSLA